MYSKCRNDVARSSSETIASSASLDDLLNVGSVRSRPRGVNVPERLLHSFNSDISRASLRPIDCHSVIRLSYSCGRRVKKCVRNFCTNFSKGIWQSWSIQLVLVHVVSLQCIYSFFSAFFFIWYILRFNNRMAVMMIIIRRVWGIILCGREI